ncbi:uncharacterized protein LOC113521972 [Galleria mellonella]|uniref:Uncharacterized protein LOC113521972 n=1 Tax=Galleria mellonella TaxID=7137 RepID=A0A6J3C0W7_GALME|nr:uncharacterized protein LOC113521972 [Galleria mellonella]
MKLLLVSLIVAFIEARKERAEHLYSAPVPEIPINIKQSNIPVLFDHIYKEGFEDPMTNLKQPLDVLELTLQTPKTRDEKQKYLQIISPKNIIPLKKEPVHFLSPKDEFIYHRISKKHREYDKKLDETVRNKSHIDDTPKFFNFEYLQTKNMNSQPKKPSVNKLVEKPVSSHLAEHDYSRSKMGYFLRDKFDMRYKGDRLNWTTCDQFGYDIHFHPKDIVDLDWVPFFTWSSKPYVLAVAHKFSYPTAKIVKVFKNQYGPYLDKSINWNEPKLLLKENRDILLVSLNRKGTFYAIPSQGLSSGKRKNLPVIKIQLKIVDPYLVMMYCDDHYTTIMAISGDEPLNDFEKKTEAAKLNISGIGYPVSRDIKAEAQKFAMEKEQKLMEENMRYIRPKEGVSLPKERFFK